MIIALLEIPVRAIELLFFSFFQCAYSSKFWNNFEEYWLTLTKVQKKLECKEIILAILDKKTHLT